MSIKLHNWMNPVKSATAISICLQTRTGKCALVRPRRAKIRIPALPPISIKRINHENKCLVR